MAVESVTRNRQIDYINKDFDSSVDALVTFANVNFGPGTSANRLWTNFNLDSFSRNWLEIVAFVSDVFFFYFDNQATQSYLQTATIRSAIEDIAKQFGFVPSTATSSSGNATFTTTGAGVIPRGFRVTSSTGQEFFVTNDITASGAGDFTGTVLQGTIKTEQFTAQGLQDEEFDLAGPNVIRDDTALNPADNTPQVVVAGNDYSIVDTFIRQTGEDSAVIEDTLGNVIGGGGRAFTLGTRPSGTPFVRFGDGIFGRKLAPGELITVTYRTGGGSAGNISAQSLVTLTDSLAFVSAVTNAADFSGGADEQSLEQLRELIPASLRTLERAVAESDYSDILTVNFNEVFAASTEPNKVDPGIDLNIYVVPQGTGITNISDNILLRNRLSDFIDRRKTVTVQFQILDAFGVDSLITLEVFVTATTSRTTINQAINTALSDFFSLTTGARDGAGVGFAEPILIRDICAILDTIDGIDRYEIKRLTYRPRIDQNIVGLVTSYNSSEVTIFPNVNELEWLLGAGGPLTETSGTVLFDNTGLTAFTYTSGTGVIQYAFPVDLSQVSPGDLFRDGSLVDFTILAVDTANNNVTLSEGLTVDTVVTLSTHGSIRNGPTSFESFKCFRKLLATTTNLSIDSITDNNLDLSVKTGTGSAIAPRELLDNTSVFVPSEFASGNFYLVDSAGNIWEIESNTSNVIGTSITAVNDAAITNVASGAYSIVNKLVGSQIVFNGNIFNIQFNSVNTVFSIGAQFSQIGTIGDAFEISKEQANIGQLGIALDLISFDAGSGQIRLNGAPSLEGINSSNVVIDSSGQIFNVIGVDNIPKPFVQYSDVNRDTEFVLEGAGVGSQVAQGFKVPATDTFAVVSFNLKREGNILGNLTARIVADAGGLPDLGSPVAVSDPIVVTDVNNAGFTKVVFSFVTPPTLSAGTQYHLVLSPDASYTANEVSGVKSFDNTGLVGFTYNVTSGVIQYASAVGLSTVAPGHFFRDGAGTFFSILAVDDAADEITIATGQTVIETVSAADDGSVFINDRILVGVDSSATAYPDGEFSRFDTGTSLWSNSTLGPSPSGSTQDMVFSVEGTKTITIESNLTPALGTGATVSKRYYDDESQISLIIGISGGTITSAPDVSASALGTVGGDPNRNVDNFVFRTSRFADDIVNLRFNEIPQIDTTDDVELQIFGGVE